MNAAVIGTGRTGGEVCRLLGPKSGAFNTLRPPTLEALRRHRVVIVFVPGDDLPSLLPLLLETALPTVIGSTGWSSDTLPEDLRTRNLAWVEGRNFSPAMILLQPVIRWLAKTHEVWEPSAFEIEETHHLHKQDRPSGTALAWRQWLGREADLHSIREGEVVGRHKLRVIGPGEEITLTHEVTDRSLFARGALMAAKLLLDHPEWRGLISFENLVNSEFFNPNNNGESP